MSTGTQAVWPYLLHLFHTYDQGAWSVRHAHRWQPPPSQLSPASRTARRSLTPLMSGSRLHRRRPRPSRQLTYSQKGLKNVFDEAIRAVLQPPERAQAAKKKKKQCLIL